MLSPRIIPLLSAAEAAEILGVCGKTLGDLRRAGKIRYVEISSRCYKYRESDLEEFIEARVKVAACQSTNRKTRRTGTTTSRSEVVGFMEQRARRLKQRRGE
ncbi:helix-turn-helix domain-containing protein [Paludibacillus litoralis]|uniref:helix-turn-helix domain-containing protein n=1 Tax=Paludibacillus litoralis TaxID=3133267 RepID=UPI0039B786CD